MPHPTLQGRALFADRLTSGPVALPNGQVQHLRKLDTSYVFPGGYCVCVCPPVLVVCEWLSSVQAACSKVKLGCRRALVGNGSCGSARGPLKCRLPCRRPGLGRDDATQHARSSSPHPQPSLPLLSQAWPWCADLAQHMHTLCVYALSTVDLCVRPLLQAWLWAS